MIRRVNRSYPIFALCVLYITWSSHLYAAPRGEYQGESGPGVFLVILAVATILGIVYFASENVPSICEFIGGILVMGMVSVAGAFLLTAVGVISDQSLGIAALLIFCALFLYPLLKSKNE